jgi:hypothetical protein
MPKGINFCPCPCNRLVALHDTSLGIISGDIDDTDPPEGRKGRIVLALADADKVNNIAYCRFREMLSHPFRDGLARRSEMMSPTIPG